MVLACAVVSILLLALAACTDLIWRTIPNAVPAGIAASFAVAALIEPNAVAPLTSAAVAAAVFAPTTLLFALNLLGGGDVKLLTATALWAGLSDIATLLFLMALAGGLLGIITGLWLGWQRWRPARNGGDLAAAPAAVTVPYGLAIAVAGIAVLAGRV